MDDIFSDDGFGLNLTIDTTDVTTDSMYSGAGVNKAGYYHVTASGVEVFKEEGKLPYVKVDLKVEEGDNKDQINKMIYHKIYVKKWADKEKTELAPLEKKQMEGIAKFAYAFGLITDEQLGNPKTNIPLHLIDGHQAIVEVRQDNDWTDSEGTQRKGGFKIPFNNAWPVHHDRVRDVPKNLEILSMAVNAVAGGQTVPDADISDL